MKNTVLKINTQDRINSRSDIAEEITELEDKTIEIFETREHKERLKQ